MTQNDERKEKLGKIEIAPEVIEVITAIATEEVEGVYELKSSFTDDVAEKLGRKNYARGVKVEITDEGITIDILVTVDFGVPIPKVGASIQEHVRKQLDTMASLEPKSINVHITSVQFSEKVE
ncbi:MAG TPA: Asp23/Gls24 family envelope stress response protein [Massilibacterium sp.]|nr:Asp23/Gls24 family envelope stress response protein [Massilibacterium sp.]